MSIEAYLLNYKQIHVKRERETETLQQKCNGDRNLIFNCS